VDKGLKPSRAVLNKPERFPERSDNVVEWRWLRGMDSPARDTGRASRDLNGNYIPAHNAYICIY